MVSYAIALVTEVYQIIMKSLPTKSFTKDQIDENSETNDKMVKCLSSHSYCR